MEKNVTLEDAQGKDFITNIVVAKVDENIEYDDKANYYMATGRNASLTVSESVCEANIWLDGSHGKSFVGNIKTLDASTSDGKNTLAGNDLDNVICAGKGDASLWGGNSSDDLLVVGKAHNLFFYTSGVSLTVDSRADVTYQLADGSQFSANHEQTTWLTKFWLVRNDGRYFESSQGYSNKVSEHMPGEDKIFKIAEYEF